MKPTLVVRGSWTRRKGQVAGILRMALLVLGLGATSLFVAVRSAKAHLAEQLARFGDELAALGDARLSSAPRLLSVNGIELHLTTASTTLPVHAALGRFRSICRERGGIEHPDSRLGATSPATADEDAPDGALLWESTAGGIVACLDTGRPLGLGDLVERMNRFGTTGDLAAIGELRYVLARRSGKTTTLLVLWTEGRALLKQAFPAVGDAPGVDPSGLPRPEHARRLLSAAERGEPYSITSYAIEADPATVADWYAHALSLAGWSVASRSGTLSARQGERTVIVRIAKNRTRSIATVMALS